MTRTDGSLARTLDFGESAPDAGGAPGLGMRSRLRLTPVLRLRGPDKYKVLTARRRQAQLKARRLLDLMDARERTR